jgi:hypothetical protein
MDDTVPTRNSIAGIARKSVWLSTTQNPCISTDMCKPGFEFEIKTSMRHGIRMLPP